MTVRRLDDGAIAVPASIVDELLSAYTRDAKVRIERGGFRIPAEVVELARLVREPAPIVPVSRGRGSGTITVAEAAARFGCTERHVRRMCAAGQISARRARAGWLVDAAAVASPDPDVRPAATHTLKP